MVCASAASPWVDYVNQVRVGLAANPPVAPLTEDPSLISKVAKFIATCSKNYDSKNKNTASQVFMYYGSSYPIKNLTPQDAMTEWILQGSYYDIATNSCVNAPTADFCTPYKKLMYDKSTAIGCAVNTLCKGLLNGATYGAIVACYLTPKPPALFSPYTPIKCVPVCII